MSRRPPRERARRSPRRSVTAILRELDLLHGRFKRAVGELIETSIAIGRCLVALKQALPHGEYLPMVKRRYGWSPDQCQNYVTIYRKAEVIRLLHRQFPDLNQWLLLDMARRAEREGKTLLLELASPELQAAVDRGEVSLPLLLLARDLVRPLGLPAYNASIGRIALNAARRGWGLICLKWVRDLTRWRRVSQWERWVIVCALDGGTGQPCFALWGDVPDDERVGYRPVLQELNEDAFRQVFSPVFPDLYWVSDLRRARRILHDVGWRATPLQNTLRDLADAYQKSLVLPRLLVIGAPERVRLEAALEETQKAIARVAGVLSGYPTAPGAQQTFFPEGEDAVAGTV